MNEFWYRDNWSGEKKTFATLAQAKRAAKKETGDSIAIFDSNNNIVNAAASGHTPK
jgi:hypothetical protein